MTTYWISNTCALFNSYNLFPFGNDINENFNALARLIIFATLVAIFVFEKESEMIMLIGGSSIFLSVILYFIMNRRSVISARDEMVYPKEFNFKEDLTRHNTKGQDSYYNNISGTTRVRGLESSPMNASYELKRSKF